MNTSALRETLTDVATKIEAIPDVARAKLDTCPRIEAFSTVRFSVLLLDHGGDVIPRSAFPDYAKPWLTEVLVVPKAAGDKDAIIEDVDGEEMEFTYTCTGPGVTEVIAEVSYAPHGSSPGETEVIDDFDFNVFQWDPLHPGLVTADRCEAEILAIKFNHEEGEATEAMKIREDQDNEVTVPEWEKGETEPNQSPVCYTLRETTGSDLTIKVKVRFIRPPDYTGQAAVAAQGGGILGRLAGTLQFQGGVTVPEFQDLTLTNETFRAAEKIDREDVTWDWGITCPHGIALSMGQTKHRVYVILEKSKEPWFEGGNEKTTAWVKALDLAMDLAENEKTQEGVLDKITRGIYDESEKVYSRNNPRSRYTSGQPFDIGPATTNLDEFPPQFLGGFQFANGKQMSAQRLVDLDKYINEWGQEVETNCYDQAAPLSALSNVLGADSKYTVVDFPGIIARRMGLNIAAEVRFVNFYINVVHFIGRDTRSNHPWAGSSENISQDDLLGGDTTFEDGRSMYSRHAFATLEGRMWDANFKLAPTAPPGYADGLDDYISAMEYATGVPAYNYFARLIDSNTENPVHYWPTFHPGLKLQIEGE